MGKDVLPCGWQLRVERNSVSASRGGCPADKGQCVGKQSWGVSWENDCKILNAGLCPCVAPAALGKTVSYHTAPCCIKKNKNKTNPKPRCPFVLHPWKTFSFWEQVMCLSLTTLLFSCIPIFLYFRGKKRNTSLTRTELDSKEEASKSASSLQNQREFANACYYYFLKCQHCFLHCSEKVEVSPPWPGGAGRMGMISAHGSGWDVPPLRPGAPFFPHGSAGFSTTRQSQGQGGVFSSRSGFRWIGKGLWECF